MFLFVQTVRHQDYFVPSNTIEVEHAATPSTRIGAISGGLLVLSLVAVILLAKLLAPFIERGIVAAGAPFKLAGVIVAAIVLLPEFFAALRAARRNQLQTSINLALGSAVACIGLTVPAVTVIATWLDQPLALGIDNENDRAAGAVVHGRHAHLRPRPHQPAVGVRPPGPAGELRVPDLRPVTLSSVVPATPRSPPWTLVHANVFIPPRPPIPARELPFLQFLRAIRTNALTMWTEKAYQEDVLVRRFLGRSHLLINAPDAIHHVLVENHANYRRSPASIRILRPITGNGLLLSDGEDWRLQRRTIAPALAPRTLPVLARHIVTSAREAVAVLGAQTEPADRSAGRHAEPGAGHRRPLDVLAGDAAVRRGDAPDAHRVRPATTRSRICSTWCCRRRSRRCAIFGRRRFQRRWMALMTEIMQARLAAPATDTPRDLFDLLLAARDPETGEGFSPDQLRDQIATMILAGHETTAVTLFWSLVLLAGAPDEQQRVAEEARGVEITPDNAMAAMPHLVRTRAVISEALRLYPPAFALAREAIGPDRVGAHRHSARHGAADRAVGAAPPPAALARPGRVRSVALPAGRAADPALRLSAVRRRPARLRRRTVRARRGDAGAGHADPRVRGDAG